jgi:hypothetical protein
MPIRRQPELELASKPGGVQASFGLSVVPVIPGPTLEVVAEVERGDPELPADVPDLQRAVLGLAVDRPRRSRLGRRQPV